MNGSLFFTGTETSNSFSGYMEGAIIASNVVAKRVTTKIKSS
jgi:monoamine oxidase